MSVAPIYIDFLARGLSDVQRAFRTVEQAIVQSERAQSRAVETGARARLRALSSTTREHAKSAQSGSREAERAAKAESKAAEKAAREKIAAYKRADREIARAQAQAVRDFERSEREKNQAAARWVREREREEAASAKRIAARRERFGRTVVGAGSAIGRAVGVGANLARTVAGLGGGFSLADAVQDRARAQGSAADIANSGYIPNADNPANRVRRSSGEILSAATAAGTPMGYSQQETLGGLGAFVGKAGDLSMGMKLMPQLAELARATGSEFEDLANAAGDVFNSDTTQSAEQLMEALRGVAGMGKVGNIEIKDVANQAAKATASASMFEGDRASNISTLFAMGQEARARGGATSATEAMTSVARFGSDVAKGTAKFGALGIKTKGAGGVLRGPEDIIKDSLRATKGDVSKLSGLFGERSVRGVLGFADIYRKAGGGKGDAKAEASAIAEVEKEFKRLKEAQISEREQRESAALRMREADMQMTQVVLQMKEAFAKELLPTILQVAPEFIKLVPLMALFAKSAGEVASWLASHPFESLGIGILAAITAALGGGVVIQSAAIAVALGKIAIDKTYDDENRSREKVRNDETEATGLSNKIRQGRATPEEVKRAQELSKTLREDVASQENAAANPGAVKTISRGIGSVFAPGATKEAAADEAAEQKRAIKSTVDSLTALDAALKKVAATAGTTGGSTDPKNRTQPITVRTGK